MAIRPTDLQNALIYQAQSANVTQRAEEAPRTSTAAAQAQFVAQTDERNERVAESGDAKGNKIDVKDRAPDQQGRGGQKGKRGAAGSFEEVVEEAAGTGDPPHLVDYSA